MISQDDIEAFAAEHEADIDAALHFARRSHELPTRSDRWAPGVTDLQAVARGVVAIHAMYNMTADAFATIWNDKMQAGQDAMRLHYPDTERADTRHGA